MLAVVDYEAMRAEAAVVASSKTSRVREYVAKLGKAQRAAEETLEMSVCNFFAVLFMQNASTLAAGIIESVPRELACNSRQSLAINASKKSSPARVIARPILVILTKMESLSFWCLGCCVVCPCLCSMQKKMDVCYLLRKVGPI